MWEIKEKLISLQKKASYLRAMIKEKPPLALL